MDEKQIMSKLYAELNKEDLWFTTKHDPTVGIASHHYKLDDYGDLTESAIKEIVKELNSYIGDGAIDINDAIEIWIQEALFDSRITYNDMLITKFKNKPVVDGIEAYENSVQFPQSKKVETKTKKTEGAGAGYNVSGVIDIKNINSFKVISQEGPDKYGDITATIDCDIDITLTEMSASSYYYGNDINVDVPAKVTGLTVKISEDDEQNDIGVDESSIKDLLDGTKFETLIGGGWTHTTFTGDIQATDNDITGSEYYYSYFTEIDIQISDENIIKYIDKVVEGENFYTEFLVYDKDDDVISDGFTAEETDYSAVDKAQNDAIEFAKANKGVRVVKHTYRELADGDLDDNDTEPEVVWERDYDKQYKYDVEENKKVTEEFWEDGEKYEYKGIVIQQSISDKGKKIYSILNRQEPFSIPDFSSLKAAKQYIDDNNLKSYKVTENYKRRLKEENNKSANLISDMFTSNDFDSDSKQGKIVMRTSDVFNALSDKGYDVQVNFDNGESTSSILLGQQGGQVIITITDAAQPLRAFASGNFEITTDTIEILQDIQTQISAL